MKKKPSSPLGNVYSTAELKTKHKRVRFFQVGDEYLIKQACAIANRRPGFQILGLPEDIEILGVWYEHFWRAFSFKACSMEWPEHDASLKIIDRHEIEVIEAPTEEAEFVLWRKMADAVTANQKLVPATEAIDLLRGKQDDKKRTS